jgi:hypothetical protein
MRNERKLREEAAEPTTFFHMAQHGVDLTLSGEGSASGYVAGSESFVRYPASGFDVGVEVGTEPSLGVPIDAMEPVGTAAEIERSLSELTGAACSDAEAVARAVETAPVIPTEAQDKLQDLLKRGLKRRPI